MKTLFTSLFLFSHQLKGEDAAPQYIHSYNFFLFLLLLVMIIIIIIISNEVRSRDEVPRGQQHNAAAVATDCVHIKAFSCCYFLYKIKFVFTTMT